MQIGVPERFSTPRADIDVVTRAARAPAILTAYRLKGADRQQVDLHLQTGIRTSERQTLASICQGPFRSVSAADPADSAVILAAVPDVQYLIHSYVLSCRNAAANTGTLMGFYFYPVNNPTGTVYVELTIVPSVAAAVSSSGVLNVLTAPNTAVQAEKVGTFASNNVVLTYSLVSGVM
jgi:hypothetical protein